MKIFLVGRILRFLFNIWGFWGIKGIFFFRGFWGLDFFSVDRLFFFNISFRGYGVVVYYRGNRRLYYLRMRIIIFGVSRIFKDIILRI